MPNTEQDTEITLGTGRMLALFFAFVLVCAFFFAIGFSLGRKTAMLGTGTAMSAPAGNPATVVRPSAVKNAASAPQTQPTDFSFYKSVEAKNADDQLVAKDSAAGASQSPSGATGNTPAANGSGYLVQVAAVTRQEDADALVDALKKKQYPAFASNTPASDKFYHVQVGPYTELKEAEAMRARLIADGYNPIVKK